MWRHHASCNHCSLTSHWCRDREESRQEILRHLQESHKIAAPAEAQDYRISQERQCDTCLEPYLDHCTKCNGDFCRLHEGDIDGLCGGCI